MSRCRPPRLAHIGLLIWCAIAADRCRAMADDPPAGYSLAWTAPGTYGGIGADRSGATVFALGVRGRCDVLNPADGSVVRSFSTTLGGTGRTIRVARLGDDRVGLVVFSVWSKGIVYSGTDGAQLWSDGGDAVDDMAVADLDGDGRDEVIVGYNGDEGLHVFGPDGKRRWQSKEVGNVWHVAAADLDGDGRPEVVSTASGGDIHVFDARDGRAIATLKPSEHGTLVGTIPGAARPPARGDLLLADSTGDDQRPSFMALGDGGKPLWSTPMPFRLRSMAPSPDGRLVALALDNAEVTVVRVGDGRIVAQIPRPGFDLGFRIAPSIAWAVAPRPGGHEPLLLVTNNGAVRAYRVRVDPEAKP